MNTTQINYLISSTKQLPTPDIKKEDLLYLIKKGYLLKDKISEKGFYAGKFTKSTKHFGFVDLEEPFDDGIYISSQDWLDALDKDEVLVWVKEGKSGKLFGEIVTVIERKNKKIVGQLVKKRKEYVLKPISVNEETWARVLNPHNFELNENFNVVGEIKKYSPLTVEIVDIIGDPNQPGVDVLTILSAHNITPVQSNEVLKQAKDYVNEVQPFEMVNRKDLTKECIFTIDGEDTKDIDDAISIKKTNFGYELGVHIADVSYYVKENSPIDLQARQRGTSVYVVDRVVAMLPIELSNRLCSLNPHVNRLAVSCVMAINLEGEIIGFDVFESVIKSRQKLSYKEVNRFFDNPLDMVMIEDEIKYNLLLMKECSMLLHNKRVKQGANEFHTIESEFILDKFGEVLEIRKKQDGFSQGMIEDFMVSANECVAELMSRIKKPSLYRIHPSPSEKKVRSLLKSLRSLGYKKSLKEDYLTPYDIQDILDYFDGKESEIAVNTLVLRSMAKAVYSNENSGHFGLGLNNYCHFTSPIRRYPDLIVHRNLKKYYLNTYTSDKDLEQDFRLVNELATTTSALEQNAVNAERAVEKMKKAHFMNRYLGKKFKGVITSVTKFGFFVSLENTCEGLVHVSSLEDRYLYNDDKKELFNIKSKESFRIGDKVKVKVIHVDLVDFEVDFKLIPIKKEKKKSGKYHRK